MDSAPPTESLSVVYIEDDCKLARLTARYLESHGLRVLLASDANEGLATVMRFRPTVVLLDLMLPGMDGLTACRELRARVDTPIIMITARGEEADRVLGLEGGADDYMTKPFSARELLARIRAQARRAQGKAGPTSTTLTVGELTVDAVARTALLSGQRLELTSYEFSLLLALVERVGTVLTREHLVDLVRGSAEEAFERSVDVHVSHLRRKLGDDPRAPRLLKTVRGVGYVLTVEGSTP
jgi:DNA-binding response OmpR family regulator